MRDQCHWPSSNNQEGVETAVHQFTGAVRVSIYGINSVFCDARSQSGG